MKHNIENQSFLLIFKYILLAILMICPFAFAVADNIPALDARLDGVKYPYKVSYLPLDEQQQHLEMAYMDINADEPNGKTVLLLHGKNFNGSYWESTVLQLTKAGYRVVVPDQIGFGKSSKPAMFQYSFQQLASNTNLLLQHLGVKDVTVVGHSIGGMLAIRFALMYPKQTKALVLEDPLGLEDWKLYIPYHTVDQLYQIELKQNLASIKSYQQNSYFHGTWKHEYDQGLAFQYGWVKGSDHALIAWTSALTSDMAFTQPVLYEFSQLKMPTLMIVGDLDRTVLTKALAPANVAKQLGNYPVLAKKAVASMPNARLIIIPGVGHVPHIEDPKDFYAVFMPFIISH